MTKLPLNGFMEYIRDGQHNCSFSSAGKYLLIYVLSGQNISTASMLSNLIVKSGTMDVLEHGESMPTPTNGGGWMYATSIALVVSVTAGTVISGAIASSYQFVIALPL